MKNYMPFLKKICREPKKRAAKALFLLLLLCFSFTVLGQSAVSPSGPMGMMGFTPGGSAVGRGLNFSPKNPHAPGGPGGVHFQATAVPAGRWEAVSLLYTGDTVPDGQRLLIRFRDYGFVPSDLYDWQLVPIARYADSDYLACVTLLDPPANNKESSFRSWVGKYNEELPKEKKFHYFQANFHSSLADTLIGFNTFLVDAMFINPPGVINGFAAVVPPDVPGYNAGARFSGINPEQDLFIRKVSRERGESSYVYNDYGTEITYDLRDGRIVFDGYPSYQFHRQIIANNQVKEVVLLDDLNKYVKANREMVNSLNPVIFKTAEQTSRWAALFRAIKVKNPAVWKAFIEQIASVPVKPEQRTPRYWIPGGRVPPELAPYLPWKESQPVQFKARPRRRLIDTLPEVRFEAPVLEFRPLPEVWRLEAPVRPNPFDTPKLRRLTEQEARQEALRQLLRKQKKEETH